ncbi:hypothetical protein AB838_22050 [Rhodobacteraceae bacterium (ex Bugula neritina AB1)]|nr:hypothetical protein AB838_22050 [Rhodobacteraceae bacterium (ex Bugula neritina AB1)]
MLIDKDSQVSIGEQLRSGLRKALFAGRIEAGARMPSSRFLAQTLGLGRNTVIDAYDTLIAEGYLVSHHGKGTFVAETLSAGPAHDRQTVRPQPAETGRRTSSRAQALLPLAEACLPSSGERILEPGVPALQAFPLERWNRCQAAANQRVGRAALSYTDPRGSLDLRRMIAAHIGPSRGVACSPDQILLLSGMRQGLHILMRLLLNDGAPVLLENPCLPETRVIVEAEGARPVAIPVTENGADVSLLSAEQRQARLAIVTPAHQYPRGYTQAAEQRASLLAWADEQDGYIIEDDYDGEFWITGNAIPTLYSESKNNRVIYLNSFSKSLFPALRVSYLVLPPDLLEAAMRIRAIFDPHVSVTAQLGLIEFIGSGAYNAHLREMRTLYRERHNVFRHALKRQLGERITIAAQPFGLHLCLELDQQFQDSDIARKLAAEGFGAQALSRYYFAPVEEKINGMVMGYAGWDAPDLLRAVKAFERLCR